MILNWTISSSSSSRRSPLAAPEVSVAPTQSQIQTYTVHILASRTIKKSTVYLVRLRREADFKMRFFLKKAVHFVTLLEKLQEELELRVGETVFGERSEIKNIPDIPKLGHFGFRASLSQLGLSDFLDVQGQKIQSSMDKLMCQVTHMKMGSTLANFFAESLDVDVRANILEWVVEMRAPVNLLSVGGFWRLDGSKRTWVLQEDGKALLDGKHRGDDYDLQETGDPETLHRSVWRKDGWNIDLERSTKDRLMWVSPGQVELEWFRLPKAEADASLTKVQESKAAVLQKQADHKKAEEDHEKNEIREIILRRAATRRLEKAATVNRLDSTMLDSLDSETSKKSQQADDKSEGDRNQVAEQDQEKDTDAAARETGAEGRAGASQPEAASAAAGQAAFCPPSRSGDGEQAASASSEAEAVASVGASSSEAEAEAPVGASEPPASPEA